MIIVVGDIPSSVETNAGGGSHWRPIQDGGRADTSALIGNVSLWGVYVYYVYGIPMNFLVRTSFWHFVQHAVPTVGLAGDRAFHLIFSFASKVLFDCINPLSGINLPWLDVQGNQSGVRIRPQLNSEKIICFLFVCFYIKWTGISVN